MPDDKIKILSEGSQINPYLKSVEDFADSNKKSLGFLPKSAFREQANRGRLWIAINADSGECLGYILYGGRYPVLRIFHLYVAPKHRKEGIGTRLLTDLLSSGEKNNYLTVTARVAADLPANNFWDRAGFPIVRQESGGRSSGRMINIRVKELNTPSLLKMMSSDIREPQKGLQGLRIMPRPLVSKQTYVLDLNIFFDVVKKRVHRAEAARLIASGLNQEIRVFVTPEFTAELHKHSEIDKPDPILEFARQLPTLPELEKENIDQLISELKAIVFPYRSDTKVRWPQSRSDLVHLAYCLHHRVTGFITREKAILSASAQLQEAYLLEVLSPADLMQSAGIIYGAQSRLSAHLGKENVTIGPAKELQREKVEQFLVSLGLDKQDLSVIWHPGASSTPRRRIIAFIDGKLIAVASWDNPDTIGRQRGLHLYVDERSPQVEIVIDHIFEAALRDSPTSYARMITLDAGPEQSKTQSTAIKRGFLRSLPKGEKSTRRGLSKFTFRGLISAENWGSFSKDFRELTGLHLPKRIPNIHEFLNTGIVIKDDIGTLVCHLNLFDFEILVSPGIVVCPGREALIVPIQARFAKDLFAYCQPQLNLFPSPEAFLRVENAYFRSPRKASIFGRGTLVLFYLSGSGGGTKEVLGCARVTYSEVLSVGEIGIALERQGVLSHNSLEKIADVKERIHAFTFDNFNPFPTRIPFHVLKTKNMISKANLVTAEKLSAQKLAQAFELGFGLRGHTNA